MDGFELGGAGVAQPLEERALARGRHGAGIQHFLPAHLVVRGKAGGDRIAYKVHRKAGGEKVVGALVDTHVGLDPDDDDLVASERAQVLGEALGAVAGKGGFLEEGRSLRKPLGDFFAGRANALGILLGRDHRDAQDVGGVEHALGSRDRPLLFEEVVAVPLLEIDYQKDRSIAVEHALCHRRFLFAANPVHGGYQWIAGNRQGPVKDADRSADLRACVAPPPTPRYHVSEVNRMYRFGRAITVILSAVALLALSSAGVEIAAAGDAALPHLEGGASCSTDSAAQSAGTAARLAEIQAQLAQSEGLVTQNLIRIYTALGGGWQPEPKPLQDEINDAQEKGEPLF